MAKKQHLQLICPKSRACLRPDPPSAFCRHLPRAQPRMFGARLPAETGTGRGEPFRRQACACCSARRASSTPNAAAGRAPRAVQEAGPASRSCDTDAGQTRHRGTHPDQTHPTGSLHAHAASPTPRTPHALPAPRGCRAARPGLPRSQGRQRELPWFLPAAVSQAQAARLWEAAG